MKWKKHPQEESTNAVQKLFVNQGLVKKRNVKMYEDHMQEKEQ